MRPGRRCHDGSVTSPLRIDTIGPVGLVTLGRPEVRNALDVALRQALRDAVAELDADPLVAAIVLTGADPAFCAGLDLADLATAGLSGPVETTRLPFDAVSTPLIGAVNGPAVTGGLEIALCCDFLVASERARFADTHARVGVMPGWGLTVLLPQAIGTRRARQMSFTGNYVDAETALAWGLVNEVVAHDELIPRATAIATDMAEIPTDHLVAIKQAYREAAAPSDGPALDAERRFGSEWSRRFDPSAFAERRAAIQERGRAQAGRSPGEPGDRPVV